jgi:hypothetical protein
MSNNILSGTTINFINLGNQIQTVQMINTKKEKKAHRNQNLKDLGDFRGIDVFTSKVYEKIVFQNFRSYQ